jgi:glutamyl-Q tRNA(Asp) synthetase
MADPLPKRIRDLLAVTVDDQLQGVTLVTRGVDVLPSTHVHVLLQKLLGYAVPQYAHHRLLTDATGRRFAKRDRDMTIRAMRESGMRRDEVVRLAHDLPDREPPARSSPWAGGGSRSK